MNLIYTLLSIIESTVTSYFSIPEFIFKASQIQCEEEFNNIKLRFLQIISNTQSIPFSPDYILERKVIINFSPFNKLVQD